MGGRVHTRVWHVPSDTFLRGPQDSPADCSSPHQSPAEARENWLTAGSTEVSLQRVPSRCHRPASCQAGDPRTPRSVQSPRSITPPSSPRQRHFPRPLGKSSTESTYRCCPCKANPILKSVVCMASSRRALAICLALPQVLEVQGPANSIPIAKGLKFQLEKPSLNIQYSHIKI